LSACSFGSSEWDRGLHTYHGLGSDVKQPPSAFGRQLGGTPNSQKGVHAFDVTLPVLERHVIGRGREDVRTKSEE